MNPSGRILAGAAAALGALVLVVVLWPGDGATGHRPIAWGRDTCARCRMHLTQPGFAGEMRDPSGTLHKFDDVGCLVGAIVATHGEVPDLWSAYNAAGAPVGLPDFLTALSIAFAAGFLEHREG